jgi:tetratricopeptide (TPR) repeat protein
VDRFRKVRGKPLVFAAGALGLAAVLTASAALVAPAGARTVAARTPRADEQVATVATVRRERRTTLSEVEGESESKDVLARAREHIELARAEGDPRHLGRAQALLAPWWNDAAAPDDVVLLRATIKQSLHDFAGARADLDTLLVRNPDDAQARLTRAVVATVMGDAEKALADCAHVGTLVGEPWASACAAPLATRNGGTRTAYARLAEIVAGQRTGNRQPATGNRQSEGAPGEAWATTSLGELARAMGDDVSAEAHFRRALELSKDDVYTLGALADLLVDGGRAAEAVALLDSHAEPDPLRLRIAIAARAAGDLGANAHAAIVRRGIDAAAARGDTTHLRERARYFLDVAPDAEEALRAAVGNWDLQREAIDARVLLEAAAAAGDRAAAAPVLAWMDSAQIDDAVLARARARLEGAR